VEEAYGMVARCEWNGPGKPLRRPDRSREGETMRVWVLLVLTFLLAAGAASAADWPCWRANPQNTGFQGLPGNMNRSPEVLWSFYVGGYANQAFARDVDGDSEEDVVYISAGQLVAVSLDGRRIWSTPPLGILRMFGFADFGLDGEEEAVACNPLQSKIFLVRLSDGIVCWNYTFPSPSSGIDRYSVKIADISPSFPGDELVVWPYKSPYGYAFGFQGCASNATPIWRSYAEEARNYPPPVAVADMDLDGVSDVVIATLEKAYCFDGATGELKMVAHSPGINRNYGILIIKNIDGDPYPEVLVLSPNLNEHLWVVDNDGHNLSQIWNKHFEYSYPEDVISIRVTVDSVADLDSDGRDEIVYSIYNQSSDARWHTVILDALTGQSLSEMLDRYLLAVVDVDGDGLGEVVTSEQHDRTVTYYSNVTILNYDDATTIRLKGCGIVYDYWSSFPLGVNSIANTDQWMQSGAGHLVRANGSLGYLRVEGGEAVLNWTLRESDVGAGLTILGTFRTGAIIAGGNDGLLRVLYPGKIVDVAWTGGFIPSSVAGDLDGDGLPEIVTRDSRGRLLVLRSDGSLEASFSGRVRWSKCGKDGSVVVWDMDGDGKDEILVGGRDRLDVLSRNGTLIRTYPLPNYPYDWVPANITGDSYTDIFVSCAGGGPHTATTMAIDGATGEMLWTKDFGPYAGFTGLMDYDEDGLDDLVVREHFDFYILIGPTGDEKKGGSICGYHTPMILDVNIDGAIEVVWGGGWGSLLVDSKKSYQFANGQRGFYMWHRWKRLFGGGDSNELYGKIPGLADIDGDGVVDLGVPDINGSLLCFDAASGRLKWKMDLAAIPSDVVSCDIDGDGLGEFILGTSDGRLLSVGRDGVEWTYRFEDAVGDPILFDIDRDGETDILAPVMDGRLYALHIDETGRRRFFGLSMILLLLGVGHGSRSKIVPAVPKNR